MAPPAPTLDDRPAEAAAPTPAPAPAPAPAKPKLPPPTETKRRSLVKTISWRTVASIDTMIISLTTMLLVKPSDTGSAMQAAAIIGMLEVPSKLLLYYLHERFWSRTAWGRL